MLATRPSVAPTGGSCGARRRSAAAARAAPPSRRGASRALGSATAAPGRPGGDATRAAAAAAGASLARRPADPGRASRGTSHPAACHPWRSPLAAVSWGDGGVYRRAPPLLRSAAAAAAEAAAASPAPATEAAARECGGGAMSSGVGGDEGTPSYGGGGRGPGPSTRPAGVGLASMNAPGQTGAGTLPRSSVPVPVYAASAAGAPPADNAAMDAIAVSPVNGGSEPFESTLAPPEMRYGPAGQKRGWVLKKGKFLDRDGMFFMHRKNRLLVLDGAKLSCFKKEEDEAPEYDISLPHAKVEGDRSHLDISVSLPHRSETYHLENPAEYDEWLRLLVSASKSSIKDYYALVAVLGEGHFGRVLLAKDRRTFERFAVKVIRKSRTQTRSQLHIQRELEILRQVNHQNVVRLYDLFDTEEKIYIVLEYMPGGALFSIIAEHKTFSEQHAASIMRDILHGLAYLHARNIVHRDLKVRMRRKDR